MSNFPKVNKPWKISVLYLVIGVMWIIFSDKIGDLLLSESVREMSQYQLIKGIFYVCLTSYLLYLLIKNLYSQVNNRNQEIQLLFSNPNLGLMKLNEEGKIIYVSENISTITKFSESELKKLHITDLTPEEFKEKEQIEFDEITHLHKNKGFSLIKYVKGKEGDISCFKVYGIRGYSEVTNEIIYIAAFEDITEQMEFLKRLESQNETLRELASEQSHLVRAPLTRILGITDLIQNYELDEDEKEELLKNLHISGNELDEALRELNKKMGTQNR
ncbi:PAS domain-containing protein [Algoriphagus machipongonensis]|uniref:histidine kinase n=1 Tax=Algoriphagus machipongonensis TaxID=388413 RepID=A3HRM6_9BACT|nr:PAS domain-containing protein [Algoriphagus machipongonensis]EAZ82494.1 putative PAS domain S-box [Algoriphagus machipongonensis]